MAFFSGRYLPHITGYWSQKMLFYLYYRYFIPYPKALHKRTYTTSHSGLVHTCQHKAALYWINIIYSILFTQAGRTFPLVSVRDLSLGLLPSPFIWKYYRLKLGPSANRSSTTEPQLISSFTRTCSSTTENSYRILFLIYHCESHTSTCETVAVITLLFELVSALFPTGFKVHDHMCTSAEGYQKMEFLWQPSDNLKPGILWANIGLLIVW